ncbi:MAG: hypothetical protein CSA84_03815 [Actinomycetales bacterium]|nr:MAG: hypothetical protein CSA84_03815 [Actinomycetales bacterium]
MSLVTALIVSLVLLALNGFFVAGEFAVVAARRHRLEERALDGGVASRTAVLNARELSLMLAGSQLGITVCTLGLGALAKPAVADVLETLLGRVGVAEPVAGIIGVLLAVFIVVFLHMVVGEMAPKSWAISDAERSAVLLAWPFRAFVTVMRPLLSVLNGLANLCLRLVKVEPQDELAQVHDPHGLRMLLETSHESGLLPEQEHQRLTGSLSLSETPVYAATLPLADAVSVAATDSLATAERISLASGRSRLIVLTDGRPSGLVHMRDVIAARIAGTASCVDDLDYTSVQLDEHLSALDAISALRAARAQLAFVTRNDEIVGIASMEDLLELLLGQFEDETDTAGNR